MLRATASSLYSNVEHKIRTNSIHKVGEEDGIRQRNRTGRREKRGEFRSTGRTRKEKKKEEKKKA
jgi:hypothetical protein